MEQLGRAKSVKVQKENTIIVDGMGDKDAISALSLIHIYPWKSYATSPPWIM